MTSTLDVSQPAHRAFHHVADLAGPRTRDARVREFVAQSAALMSPDRIAWCTGSAEEERRLIDAMVETGTLIPLDSTLRPDSYLARSSEDDVARVEARTFICSKNQEDAGPTNNWAEPRAMHDELDRLMQGSMRGRTMYVIPFSMGPVGGKLSQLGVQLTDSPYVALSMARMTVVGDAALELFGPNVEWVRCLHSVGMPLAEPFGGRIEDVAWPSNPVKYIAHFPEERQVISFGSGYGGNALLGKKAFALRIASAMAHDEGWLAEHMLIVRVTAPSGRQFHIAGAFPSACGKTNLAMAKSSLPGYKVETIGDDIAWLRRDADGKLRAINPESGFFGVAPGTSEKTNPVAMEMMSRSTIFTNTALTDDGDVWWEGMTDETPAHLVDWKGDDWTPESGTPAAHPNARFTVRTSQCPTIADQGRDGVVIDAIVFGGRRSSTVPLVAQADSWRDGVMYGAMLASERTAAAEGAVGELRHDPFAMLPFCGYNMADYLQHWLDFGVRLGEDAPAIFSVNWFRRAEDGSFLWPGFGENVRVLAWIIDRLEGRAKGERTAIGTVPQAGEINRDGIEVSDEVLAELLAVDPADWAAEAREARDYFEPFGNRFPVALRERLRDLMRG